jgi:hypothetical protein
MDLDELLAEDMDWQGAAQSQKSPTEGKGPQDVAQRLADQMNLEGAAQSQGPAPSKRTKPKRRKAA